MKVEDHIPSIASCSFPAKQMYNLSHSSPHFCYGILFVVHVNQSWFYSVSIVLIRSSNITTEYQALCICYDMPFKAFDFFAPFYCLMTLLSRVINGLSTSSNLQLFPDHILEPNDFFDDKDLARKVNLITQNTLFLERFKDESSKPSFNLPQFIAKQARIDPETFTIVHFEHGKATSVKLSAIKDPFGALEIDKFEQASKASVSTSAAAAEQKQEQLEYVTGKLKDYFKKAPALYDGNSTRAQSAAQSAAQSTAAAHPDAKVKTHRNNPIIVMTGNLDNHFVQKLHRALKTEADNITPGSIQSYLDNALPISVSRGKPC